MSKNNNTKKLNLTVLIPSILFILFGAFCVFLGVAAQKYILFSTAIACLLVTLTMNFADRFNVNKHNSKTVNIICAVLTVIAIPLVYFSNIYSLVFSVPALFLSSKNAKIGKNRIALVLLVLSFLTVIGAFIYGILKVN